MKVKQKTKKGMKKKLESQEKGWKTAASRESDLGHHIKILV
jgi:hypothetical protein